jgi:hypothetical protein
MLKMTDIIERLRAAIFDERLSTGALYTEAAREIEGLRIEIEVLEESRDGALLQDRDALFTENRRLRAALELIATPPRPDGTWNRDRQACYELAREALEGTP